MKQITFMLSMLFLIGTAFGQNIIDKHFSAYKGQDNFTKVRISPKAFELAAYLEIEGEDADFTEFKDFLSTVHAFEMIAGSEVDNAARKYRSALSKVLTSHDELMNVKEKEGDLTFFVEEDNGTVHELVMVGYGEEGHLVIFSLRGNMDLEQLSKMSRKLKADDELPAKEMFDNGIHETKVYPNPLRAGEALNIEVPESMAHGRANIYDLNGNLVKTFTFNSRYKKLETSDLRDGNYVIELKNDKVSIKKKIIIR